MQKTAENDTGVGLYYFKYILRYWRIFVKLIVRKCWKLNKCWSEITVDELYDLINSNRAPIIIDLRSPEEFANGHISNALSMPITKIAKSKDLQLYKEKEIVTICPGGGLSLIGVEVLEKAGFQNVKSLHEGLDKWVEKGYPVTKPEKIAKNNSKDKTESIEAIPLSDKTTISKIHHTVDARGMSCPKPILKSRKALKSLKINQVLEILTTDPGSQRDIPAWVAATEQELLLSEKLGPKNFRFLVKRINLE